jgi:hypothetical protein
VGGSFWDSLKKLRILSIEVSGNNILKMISSFEVGSYSISVFFLDSSTNRRITKKKWGIDS